MSGSLRRVSTALAVAENELKAVREQRAEIARDLMQARTDLFNATKLLHEAQGALTLWRDAVPVDATIDKLNAFLTKGRL